MSAAGGGALYSLGTSVSAYLSKTVFDSCSSDASGGAISVTASSSMYLVGCILHNNTARAQSIGGAIAADFASLLLVSCNFSGNAAQSVGGAIAATSSSSLTLIECDMNDNTAHSMGGAISATDSSLSLLGCEMNHNLATGMGGGAVHINQGYFSAYNTAMSYNSAPGGGGGGLLWQNWVGPAGIVCPVGTEPVQASCTSESGLAVAVEAACLFGTCACTTISSLCAPCKQDVFSDGLNSSLCRNCTKNNSSACKDDFIERVLFTLTSEMIPVAKKHILYRPTSRRLSFDKNLVLTHSFRMQRNTVERMQNVGRKEWKEQTLRGLPASTIVDDSPLLKKLCRTNNFAQYGLCVATDFWTLLVPAGITNKDRPAYAGLAISVTVYKKDAYNQTILSDSSSFLEIRTSLNGSAQADPSVSVLGTTVVQLDRGSAMFVFQLKPSFSSVMVSLGITIMQTDVFIYFDGLDTADPLTRMQTLFLPVTFSEGFDVCPQGYVLIFDSPTNSTGPAQCQWCSAGSYSVSPLASKVGLIDSSNPACLNCPAGGDCLKGGSDIKFKLGVWKLDTDQHRLMHCPPGTQLINSTRGDSKGTYSHDAQHCKPCLISEYILDPNIDSCQMCPPGLVCYGSDEVAPKMNGSKWLRNGSIFLLLSCPSGYSVSSTGASGTFDATVQQCNPCPKGEECVTPSCRTCFPCQPGFYKTVVSAEACAKCPADTFNLQRGSQDLSSCQSCQAHASTQGRTAQTSPAACICEAQYYAFASQCLSCPKGATCSDGFCALRLAVHSCPDDQTAIGTWKLDNSSGKYSLAECPAGYLLNFEQCEVCPASYYCSGGLSTPCASDYFSLPGSSDKSSCEPSVYVVVVINLPILRPFFKFDQTSVFQNFLANLTRINQSYVTVNAVQAGSDTTTTDITSNIATSNASSADVLFKSLTQNASAVYERSMSIGSQFKGYHLVSVEVSACVPGYELESQPPPSICRLCSANYYCTGGASGREPCAQGRFADAGANMSGVCKDFAVNILVTLPLFYANFTVAVQSAFVSAVAYAVGVSIERVSIIFEPEQSRRLDVMSGSVGSQQNFGRQISSPSLQIKTQITADTATEAIVLSNRVDPLTINKNLEAVGLPQSVSISVDVKNSYIGVLSEASQSLPTSVITGSSVGGVLFVFLVLAAIYHLGKIIMNQRRHKAFVTAILNSKRGDPATPQMLPPALGNQYTAEKVAGKGAFGCVVKANLKKKGSDQHVAIKIILPEKGNFDEQERRRLWREASVHELFMSQNCEHAVRLAGSTYLPQHRSAQDVFWIVLEFLAGDDLHNFIYSDNASVDAITPENNPLDDRECIKVARCVLAALKVMHSAGLVHRDIKPENIMRCHLPLQSAAVQDEGLLISYKLIDFGSAIGVDEKVAKQTMMTLTGNRALAVGTPPYMSPEMFKEPETASYPTDVWSLGVTMFELVTTTLPFQSDNELLWSFAVAGNMDEKAPNVLDALHEGRRPTFDYCLSQVIAKALEKKVVGRYGSADEMHEAVYACLIQRGEAYYSAFISYRVASEAPLARILFDELNHSVTPGGHRVTVYWDAHRLVKGEDWEAGFAAGLLHSVCFLPLLSFGFTAPLAAIPEKDLMQVIANGWEAKPLGRQRLTGSESDPEDNCLKELLIAAALLEHAKSKVGREGGETALLKVAYPLLIGRQQPLGHKDYPRMGSFFAVQGGGGSYPNSPSPPTARCVVSFLQNKAKFSLDAAAQVAQMSVQDAVSAFTRLQGCQLWNHPKV
jgi:serine/threonine protein kinase